MIGYSDDQSPMCIQTELTYDLRLCVFFKKKLGDINWKKKLGGINWKWEAAAGGWRLLNSFTFAAVLLKQSNLPLNTSCWEGRTNKGELLFSWHVYLLSKTIWWFAIGNSMLDPFFPCSTICFLHPAHLCFHLYLPSPCIWCKFLSTALQNDL